MHPFPLFLSLLFSLSADYLFFCTPYDLAGVLLFIAVQYCHSRLIGVPGVCWLKHGLSLALPAYVLCTLLLFSAALTGTASSPITVQSSLLLATALCYFSFLVCNFLSAWKRAYRTLPLPFCICLTLLMLCDLHVGLYNLPRFLQTLPLPILSYCTGAAYTLIWIFYLPSQCIMLVLFLRALQRA